MNDQQPTFCETCDNVHPETRKRSPTQWLCLKFRRIDGGGFVAPTVWAKEEPFLKCSAVNGGACPFYRSRRDGQLEMGT